MQQTQSANQLLATETDKQASEIYNEIPKLSVIENTNKLKVFCH